MQGNLRRAYTCQRGHLSKSPGSCLNPLFVLNVIGSGAYKKIAVNRWSDKNPFPILVGSWNTV